MQCSPTRQDGYNRVDNSRLFTNPRASTRGWRKRSVCRARRAWRRPSWSSYRSPGRHGCDSGRVGVFGPSAASMVARRRRVVAGNVQLGAIGKPDGDVRSGGSRSQLRQAPAGRLRVTIPGILTCIQLCKLSRLVMLVVTSHDEHETDSQSPVADSLINRFDIASCDVVVKPGRHLPRHGENAKAG